MQRQSSRPGKHGPEPRALAERFWEKVDRHGPDECWPWTAARFDRGYGAFRVGPKQRKAHVVALELTLGRPLLPDKKSCHTCDNPPCCNPAHLWEGTDAENHADRNRKGRQAKGDRAGMRLHPWKLDAETADAIRQQKGKERQKDTAKRYGVSQTMVWKIQTERAWVTH